MNRQPLTSLRRRLPTLPGGFRRSGAVVASSPVDPETVWFNRFQAVFAVIAGLALLFTLIDTSAPLNQRLLSVPIVALVVVCYLRLIVGRDARESRDALLYLGIAMPSFFALILLHPAYQLLTFAGYWQIFAFLRTRLAMVVAAILTLMMLAAGADQGVKLPLLTGSDWVIFASSMVTGGMMAAFIHSLFTQSERRRLLIEELNATRARLLSQERTAGMLQERHRIASDFHDTVAQDLASVVMHLEAAEARLPPGTESARTHVGLARDTARSGLVEARRIVHALVPDVLNAHSISDALRITTSRWSASTHTPCSYEIVGDPPQLDRSLDVVLLRSLQEALTNVRKHANASSVVVTLTNLGDEVVLDVHDDGRGFDPKALPDGSTLAGSASEVSGMGLLAMRQRVGLSGGSLSIESTRGSGTTISVSLPVSPPENPRADAFRDVVVEDYARV